MADELPGALTVWPKETIADKHFLFMRVHRNTIIDGAPIPGSFINHGTGMSTDWSKYSSPLETRSRGKQPASNYGVVKLSVRETRTIPGQTVAHTPLLDNRAHADVFGEKDTQVRLMFTRIASWAIRLEEQVS